VQFPKFLPKPRRTSEFREVRGFVPRLSVQSCTLLTTFDKLVDAVGLIPTVVVVSTSLAPSNALKSNVLRQVGEVCSLLFERGFLTTGEDQLVPSYRSLLPVILSNI
jgi:hypothetical protein